MGNGYDLNQIAVLVRAGFQTREIEERFLAIGLPYKVVGTRFYERAEIRDAMAYLRLINQPADDLAFERIINTPKRGLGTASLQQIYHLARSMQTPLLAAAGALQIVTSCARKRGGRWLISVSKLLAGIRKKTACCHQNLPRKCWMNQDIQACGRQINPLMRQAVWKI